MEEYKLINVMEEIVNYFLEVLIQDPRLNVCTCERCKMDIKALALNELRPKYAVTPKGEVLIKVSELGIQHAAEVESAIIKAIMQVSKNPRHDQLPEE